MKNNLKVHRAIKNLTQAQLAKKIGVSRQTINAIESQNYVPSAKLALKLSREFNVTVNDIFVLRDEVESQEVRQLNDSQLSVTLP
ncbi:MAG: helix-turn-helix transcriptional regulator [Saprospiraceae bacterium]|nr:helix-turn-helix transcriptional regulator [Bacteroidia bacterium]NNE14860.1 helix-turn-helix transcriptional regulator [Saprospiraceae bacterium]NNL91902.1 helix-turn-helix transcriptional regulator [Saprospiraceae bacterium]